MEIEKLGFDNKKYLEMQSDHIKKRVDQFDNKLYLEFGGKLFDDYHASRVLPGFEPDSKIRLLKTLADKAEIVIAINAYDIENNKMRGDYGITYEEDVLRLIDAFNENDLDVCSVVITRYCGQVSAANFKKRLNRLGVTVYLHYSIAGYPSNIPLIISDDGFGRNDYIVTTKPLVVVTAPGPGSGKMAVCLSQLYHDYKMGKKSGYAKFETFPIWNMPLKHPINLAYESATADLNDVNMIDPYHLEAYGETTINYNRDVEVFPILSSIFQKITGKSPYKSPTDMGVNMVGNCIIDDDIVCEASKQEIIRRYYKSLLDKRLGRCEEETVHKVELLMNQLDINTDYRKTTKKAHDLAAEIGSPVVTLELKDGRIIKGKTSDLMGPSAAVLLNALKALADIDQSIHLISPSVIEPVQKLKIQQLGNQNPRLHTDEILIALAISATTNPVAKKALEYLSKLRNCEAHSTTMLASVDENTFRKLSINITCDPTYQSNKLYHK